MLREEIIRCQTPYEMELVLESLDKTQVDVLQWIGGGYVNSVRDTELLWRNFSSDTCIITNCSSSITNGSINYGSYLVYTNDTFWSTHEAFSEAKWWLVDQGMFEFQRPVGHFEYMDAYRITKDDNDMICIIAALKQNGHVSDQMGKRVISDCLNKYIVMDLEGEFRLYDQCLDAFTVLSKAAWAEKLPNGVTKNMDDFKAHHKPNIKFGDFEPLDTCYIGTMECSDIIKIIVECVKLELYPFKYLTGVPIDDYLGKCITLNDEGRFYLHDGNTTELPWLDPEEWIAKLSTGLQAKLNINNQFGDFKAKDNYYFEVGHPDVNNVISHIQKLIKQGIPAFKFLTQTGMNNLKFVNNYLIMNNVGQFYLHSIKGMDINTPTLSSEEWIAKLPKELKINNQSNKNTKNGTNSIKSFLFGKKTEIRQGKRPRGIAIRNAGEPCRIASGHTRKSKGKK